MSDKSNSVFDKIADLVDRRKAVDTMYLDFSKT